MRSPKRNPSLLTPLLTTTVDGTGHPQWPPCFTNRFAYIQEGSCEPERLPIRSRTRMVRMQFYLSTSSSNCLMWRPSREGRHLGSVTTFVELRVVDHDRHAEQQPATDMAASGNWGNW